MNNIESIVQHEQNFQLAIQANYELYYMGYVSFICGAAFLFVLIKKQNSYSYKESALALTGLKKFKRNYTINIVQALTIILPVTMWLYVFTSYKNS